MNAGYSALVQREINIFTCCCCEDIVVEMVVARRVCIGITSKTPLTF